MTGDDDTATGVARLYIGARLRAALLSSRQLRRVERGYRRDNAPGGPGLDRAGRAAWAACRSELHDRGKRIPDPGQPPRRRWWR